MKTAVILLVVLIAFANAEPLNDLVKQFKGLFSSRSIHPITQLDHMFCMNIYKDQIKQLRKIPGKESAHAEAYDPGLMAETCKTYCQMFNGVTWVNRTEFISPEFTPCGVEKVCSADGKCSPVLNYTHKNGTNTNGSGNNGQNNNNNNNGNSGNNNNGNNGNNNNTTNNNNNP